jgi:type IV secretion system protein VirB2
MSSMTRARASSLAFAAWAAGSAAGAKTAQTDPAGSGPILAALQWIQGTLLGNLATTAAVIAVAVVGLMMLTGRIEWRRDRGRRRLHHLRRGGDRRRHAVDGHGGSLAPWPVSSPIPSASKRGHQRL